MPNAADKRDIKRFNFLWIGPPGSGKTAQYWTLPGRGFVYVFDPNWMDTMEGASHVDYEEFLPDLLDINIHPMAKDKKADTIIKPTEPITYIEWEKHFDEALDSGLFDQYDWIGMDSFTTFSDAVMDRTQYINGRLGKQPEVADWTTQMFTIQNVFRSMAAQGKPFFATAHDELRQDDAGGGRMKYQPVMTGRLRTRIPLLFGNIFRMECDSSRAGVDYVVHTVSDSLHQYVRISKRIHDLFAGSEGGTPPELDVKIEDFSQASSYGMGSLLKKAGFFDSVESAQPPKKRAQTRRK